MFERVRVKVNHNQNSLENIFRWHMISHESPVQEIILTDTKQYQDLNTYE